MESNLKYKPNHNNKQSFIVYKFSIMPQNVIEKDIMNFKELSSYELLMLNNEFVNYLLETIETPRMCNMLTINMLIAIKDIITESINFKENFSTKSQQKSNIYKDKDINIDDIEINGNNIDDLYTAKYFCFKEAYDIEFTKEYINEFNINNANKLLTILKQIVKPGFTIQAVNQLKIFSNLELAISLSNNKQCTLLETSPSLLMENNVYFKAFVCSNEILEYIERLFENDLLKENNTDFCLSILKSGIYAKQNKLDIYKKYLLDNQDIMNFNSKKAENLKTKLICKKYKKGL